MAETGTQPSMADSAVTWVLENKLRAVFYTWATGVGGSLVSAALFGACPFCHHCAHTRTRLLLALGMGAPAAHRSLLGCAPGQRA